MSNGLRACCRAVLKKLYGACLYFAFVGANIQFIYSMATKNQERVRTVILVNWGFASLLVILLAYGKVTGRGAWNPATDCAVDYKTHLHLCKIEGQAAMASQTRDLCFCPDSVTGR